MTPGDVRACIAVLSRSGRFLRGDQESLRRLEHLFIQPVVLGVAFGSLLKPFAFQTSGRDIRHTLNQPAGLPFSSPPRRVAVSRSSSWLVRPLNEPYLFQSEKTRDKDLKKHGDLDHQSHSLRVVGLGFKIAFTVNSPQQLGRRLDDHPDRLWSFRDGSQGASIGGRGGRGRDFVRCRGGGRYVITDKTVRGGEAVKQSMRQTRAPLSKHLMRRFATRRNGESLRLNQP